MWGRSRLLSRARRRHGVAEGAPEERGYGYYKKVEGRVFTLAEHLLSFVAPLGEELVMFAHRV